MTLSNALNMLNYSFVLIYGVILSTSIAGGYKNEKQKHLIGILCPLLLLVSGLCSLLFGLNITQKLYPFIVHLPLMLILIFVLKKHWDIALVSVCTAYLCCQVPLWVELAGSALTGSALIGELCYTISIFPIYLLLQHYFVRVAHSTITYSKQALFLFGSLPFAYYLFDYATTVYSNTFYLGIPALIEFFPTLLITFYMVFISAYHGQTQKRIQSELQKSMLESALKQSGSEIENLRHAEMQTIIYHHDMRHHLTVIDGYLSMGNTDKAKEYIQKVIDVNAVTPKRYCENETVNLLCSSFSNRAQRQGIRLIIKAYLPKCLSISDTELCSILSNGLENALRAVHETQLPDKWIEMYCNIKSNKLLIEIKNPYIGEIIMKNGLPVSSQDGPCHGYGCQSILSIAKKHHGLCNFDSQNHIFTLRVVLPNA